MEAANATSSDSEGDSSGMNSDEFRESIRVDRQNFFCDWCMMVIRSSDDWNAHALDEHFEREEGKDDDERHDPNYSSEQFEGITPLHIAAMEGPASCVAVLLNHGARHDVRCYHGRTPLLHAALNGRFDESVLLLKAGADVHAREDDGNVPFAWAARHGRPATAKLLLRHGASLDDFDGDIHDPFTDNSPAAQYHRECMRDVRALVEGVDAAGSYREYELRARVRLLALLELCAAGRATPGSRCPEVLRRLFPAPATSGGAARGRTRAARFAHSAAVNALPKALLWEVLAFWRNF